MLNRHPWPKREGEGKKAKLGPKGKEVKSRACPKGRRVLDVRKTNQHKIQKLIQTKKCTVGALLSLSSGIMVSWHVDSFGRKRPGLGREDRLGTVHRCQNGTVEHISTDSLEL